MVQVEVGSGPISVCLGLYLAVWHPKPWSLSLFHLRLGPSFDIRLAMVSGALALFIMVYCVLGADYLIFGHCSMFSHRKRHSAQNASLLRRRARTGMNDFMTP